MCVCVYSFLFFPTLPPLKKENTYLFIFSPCKKIKLFTHTHYLDKNISFFIEQRIEPHTLNKTISHIVLTNT